MTTRRKAKRNGSHGDSPDTCAVVMDNDAVADTVDMQQLLDDVSARLVIAGSVLLPAAEPVETIDYSVRLQAFTFMLGSTCFAIELSHVDEVIRRPQITRLPGQPAWLLGITSVHGNIVSVVDLVRFLDVGQCVTSSDATLIVTHAADQQIGLLVDDVSLIYTFPEDELAPPPYKVEPGIEDYLCGALDRDHEFIHLLDCERLLLGKAMQQFS